MEQLETKAPTPPDPAQTATWLNLLPDVIPGVTPWTRVMIQQMRPFIDSYMQQAARGLWARLFPLAFGPTDFPPPSVPTDGTQPPTTGSLAVGFDVVSPKLNQAVDALTLAFSESTNATTSDDLQTALKNLREDIRTGLFAGDPLPELRKRVNDVFDGAEKWRARAIAASEASRAVHKAENIAATASGVVKTKTWLLSADACPLCQELKGRTVPLDQPFIVLDTGRQEYRSIDHPPRHPSCQCSETLGLDRDALGPGVDLNDAEGLLRWAERQ